MQNSLPEFTKWVNPVLRALSELGGSARPREVVERVAKNENVPDDVLDQLNPAGGQRFPNQVHWARFYLADSGYIDRSKHGVWKLTDTGAALPPLDEKAIDQLIKAVQERIANSKVSGPPVAPDVPSIKVIESSPTQIGSDDEHNEVLAPDQEDGDYRVRLMHILRSLAPSGFERLCQRLLREAGFEQVTVTGKSNDGGIDGHGILVLNPFVSFRVLFQCKRYVGSVVPGQVPDFRGAMQGRADKGLILTTGTFTVEARREAGRDGAPPIELVDGEKLIGLFEQLELGLRPVTSYEINESFFLEYR